MKIHTGYIYFLSLTVWILFVLGIAHSAEIDPYPTVVFPIFKEGYNLKKHFDASKQTKSIRYYVQSGYPPAEVLEFYDAYFNGSGWRPSFEICQRNWAELDQGTKTAEPLLRRLFASWEHPEFNLKALLWLTFETAGKGQQNEVTVECRVQPSNE